MPSHLPLPLPADIMALRCKGRGCEILNYSLGSYSELLPLLECLSQVSWLPFVDHLVQPPPDSQSDGRRCPVPRARHPRAATARTHAARCACCAVQEDVVAMLREYSREQTSKTGGRWPNGAAAKVSAAGHRRLPAACT